MYRLQPLTHVINDLKHGTKVQKSVILRYLNELQERQNQTCKNCRRYIDGCCNAPIGLMGAHPGDYCSRWRPRPEHTKIVEE